MLKLVIDSLDEVEEPLRGQYNEDGGKYRLQVDVTNSPEYQAVKRTKEQLLREKKEAKEAEAEAKRQAEQEHLESLEKDSKYKEALAEFKKQTEDRISSLERSEREATLKLEKSLMDGAVSTLSSELAGERSALLAPHIRNRLKVVNGELKILGIDGTESDSTLKQLGDEFRNTEMFAPLILGNQSGGSGSNGSGRGAGPASEHEKYFKPETWNLTKQAELMQSNPDEYKRLKAKYPDKVRALR